MLQLATRLIDAVDDICEDKGFSEKVLGVSNDNIPEQDMDGDAIAVGLATSPGPVAQRCGAKGWLKVEDSQCSALFV